MNTTLFCIVFTDCQTVHEGYGSEDTHIEVYLILASQSLKVYLRIWYYSQGLVCFVEQHGITSCNEQWRLNAHRNI